MHRHPGALSRSAVPTRVTTRVPGSHAAPGRCVARSSRPGPRNAPRACSGRPTYPDLPRAGWVPRRVHLDGTRERVMARSALHAPSRRPAIARSAGWLQPSTVVVPKMASNGRFGAGPMYIRAVSKAGVKPRRVGGGASHSRRKVSRGAATWRASNAAGGRRWTSARAPARRLPHRSSIPVCRACVVSPWVATVSSVSGPLRKQS